MCFAVCNSTPTHGTHFAETTIAMDVTSSEGYKLWRAALQALEKLIVDLPSDAGNHVGIYMLVDNADCLWEPLWVMCSKMMTGLLVWVVGGRCAFMPATPGFEASALAQRKLVFLLPAAQQAMSAECRQRLLGGEPWTILPLTAPKARRWQKAAAPCQDAAAALMARCLDLKIRVVSSTMQVGSRLTGSIKQWTLVNTSKDAEQVVKLVASQVRAIAMGVRH